MTAKSVSFVIPMFNEADNIELTIRRASELAAQISSDYEIVIADDASTDSCPAIVDRIAAKDPHIRLVRLKVNSKFGGRSMPASWLPLKTWLSTRTRTFPPGKRI